MATKTRTRHPDRNGEPDVRPVEQLAAPVTGTQIAATPTDVATTPAAEAPTPKPEQAPIPAEPVTAPPPTGEPEPTPAAVVEAATTMTEQPPAVADRILFAPPIDPATLAVPDDYQKECEGGQERSDDAPLAISVCKANGRMGFFRAHPTLFTNVYVLEVAMGLDRGHYLISAAVKKVLDLPQHKHLKPWPCRLTLCYAREAGSFLLPARWPEEGKKNRQDPAATSVLNAIKVAEKEWIVLFWAGQKHDYTPAKGITDQPKWPKMTMDELIGLGFDGKRIETPNDPLIRRLLGQE